MAHHSFLGSVVNIGQDERLEAQHVVNHAAHREHWIGPRTLRAPSADPQHVLHLGPFLCTYAVVEDCRGQLLRYLSVQGVRKFPEPKLVWTLASELFGYTRWKGGEAPSLNWQVGLDDEDKCVIVTEVMK